MCKGPEAGGKDMVPVTPIRRLVQVGTVSGG